MTELLGSIGNFLSSNIFGVVIGSLFTYLIGLKNKAEYNAMLNRYIDGLKVMSYSSPFFTQRVNQFQSVYLAIHEYLFLLDRFFDRRELEGENRDIDKDLVELRKQGVLLWHKIKAIVPYVEDDELETVKKFISTLTGEQLIEAISFEQNFKKNTNLGVNEVKRDKVHHIGKEVDIFFESLFKKYALVQKTV